MYCTFKIVVYKEAFSNVQHGEIGGLNMVICVIAFVYLCICNCVFVFVYLYFCVFVFVYLQIRN